MHKWLIIAGAAAFGFWLVSRLIDKCKDASGQNASAQKPSLYDWDAPRHWSDVLDLPRNASIDRISRQYKERIKQYHPDKVAEMGVEFKVLADRKTKELNTAYEQALEEKRHS